MKGSTIVIGGFLFQNLPAKIFGWTGEGDRCQFCSIPKFVKGCSRNCKNNVGMCLRCGLTRNKNLIWRKVVMPMPSDIIKNAELQARANDRRRKEERNDER